MEIVIGRENMRITTEGAAEVGSQEWRGRRGSFQTYEVRLRPAVVRVAYPEPGDTVRYHRLDGDLPCYLVGGELQKSDGRRFQLIGSADVGIDTGHPPNLGLQYVQVWCCAWEDAFSHHFPIVRELSSGKIFHCLRERSLGDLSRADLGEELDLATFPPLPLGERWEIVWDEKIPYGSSTMEDHYGFHVGKVRRQVKRIDKRDTGIPLVL